MPQDTQIVNSATHPAPKDYTVPGNAELLLKAVQATYVDNGASGAWLPCVTLISDSGHVIARAIDRSVVIAAGASAEVSWFPWIGGGGGGAGASVGTTWGYYSTSFPQTVAPGIVTNLEWDFAGGTAMLDLTDPTNPTALATGIYSVEVTFEGINFAAQEVLQGTLQTNTIPSEISTAYAVAGSNFQPPQGFVSLGLYLAAGDAISFFAINRATVNRQAVIQQANVHLLVT
jgi:hypothetical protein